MEASWPERGYYLVSVDTDRVRTESEPKHEAQLRANPRRTFHRISMKTDLYVSPDSLYDSCQELLSRGRVMPASDVTTQSWSCR